MLHGLDKFKLHTSRVFASLYGLVNFFLQYGKLFSSNNRCDYNADVVVIICSLNFVLTLLDTRESGLIVDVASNIIVKIC